MTELGPLIIKLILKGMDLWPEERRINFKKTHHKILTEISSEENKTYPHFSGAKLDKAREELDIFLEAYITELDKVSSEKVDKNEK